MKDDRVQYSIEGDANGEIRRVMDTLSFDPSITDPSSFPESKVRAALSEHGLRAEDITAGDYSLKFEIAMDTGHIFGAGGPLHPFAPPNEDLSRQIHAAIERAMRQPMDGLTEKLRAAIGAAEAVDLLKQAKAEGLLGFFPTHGLLEALEAMDLSSADPVNREFLRRARMEAAQRLQRHDIVASEAEQLLTKSPDAFSAQEKAELEVAVAIGLALKGRTEAALTIWRRLVGPDSALTVEGRAWAWRNISLTLRRSDPEAKEAAQRSADAFLQMGNKRQAGTRPCGRI